MEGRILGGRPVGRPRRRWIDAVCQDAREQLGVKIWRRESEDRKSWRHLIEEALDCSAIGERERNLKKKKEVKA
jgi:hypothetical protein